jgi:hypothetical protein
MVSVADPPRSLISIFSAAAVTFLSSSSSFILTRLSGSGFRRTAKQKVW